jgi:hypothetical protein
MGWPEDVESVWNFLVRPTGVMRSQCDVASYHIVFPIFVEGFLVHDSQMAPFLSLSMQILKFLNQISGGFSPISRWDTRHEEEDRKDRRDNERDGGTCGR